MALPVILPPIEWQNTLSAVGKIKVGATLLSENNRHSGLLGRWQETGAQAFNENSRFQKLF